jgi:hypothetical protein
MNTKTKVLTGLLLSLVTVMVLYAPLTQATQTTISLGDELAEIEVEEAGSKWACVRPKVRFVVWFLRNSEPVQVEGTIVALSDHKLILATAADQIRVHLPAEWTVNGNVLTREELFTSGFMSEGEAVTIKALQADVDNQQGATIYITVGYEIVNQSSVHAFANLGVNIED